MLANKTAEITRRTGHKSEGAAVAGNQPEQELRTIMDGLAETVLDASDEEIFEEVREEGRDPLRTAEEVRKLLLDATGATGTAKPGTTEEEARDDSFRREDQHCAAGS